MSTERWVVVWETDDWRMLARYENDTAGSPVSIEYETKVGDLMGGHAWVALAHGSKQQHCSFFCRAYFKANAVRLWNEQHGTGSDE